MRIDLQVEQVMSLSEAARFFPRIDGRLVSANTVWRWTRQGFGGVVLERARLGHRIVTSREAVARFLDRLSEADEARRDETLQNAGEPAAAV